MEELEEDSATKPEDPLIRALDELGEGSGFLWMIFFFTMFPTIFAGMHSNTYIFIAQVRTSPALPTLFSPGSPRSRFLATGARCPS